MKIEVTNVSVSKKGTVWIQAKLLEGETPRTQDVFEFVDMECPHCGTTEMLCGHNGVGCVKENENH